MKTKELALAVLYAVLLAGVANIVQYGRIITGIAGITYIFSIFGAIPASITMLTFQGRRWRFLLTGTITFFLIIPTSVYGTPFDLTAKIIYLITVAINDIVWNTFHNYFKNCEKLYVWASLFTTSAMLIPIPLTLLRFQLLGLPLIITTRMIQAYSTLVYGLLWLIILEAVVGAIIGYKIYKRIEKLLVIQ